MGMGVGLLVEAEPVIHELGQTAVHDAVVDVDPVAAGAQDAEIHQAPELVGDRLRLHADRVGEIGHAGVAQQDERMKQAESCVGGKYLEDPRQLRRFTQT